MNKKINLHTHTTYCDGKNTIEENIISAIEKNFTILGFSSHSLFPLAKSWHIAPRNFQDYVQEVRFLQEKYSDKIQILCGFEADFFSNLSLPCQKNYELFKPDFLIGSVHYVFSKKGYYSVDNSVEKVKEKLIRLYGNQEKGFESVNGKKAVCEYFATQREMLKKGDFQIWGHPDVIRKRNGILHFFNENESWYKKELIATAKVAAKTGVIAEINTGGMARKVMNEPYPSTQFLEILFNYKIPVQINSDAHNKEDLDFAFDFAKKLAKKIGYKELIYPVKEKIVSIEI